MMTHGSSTRARYVSRCVLSPIGTSGSCPMPIWLRVLGHAGSSRRAQSRRSSARMQLPNATTLALASATDLHLGAV
jgi:hypothetical protein